jgi:hypothetical protein
VDFVAVSGLIAAAVGVLVAYQTYRPSSRIARFRETYADLSATQTALSEAALARSPPSWRSGDVPMLGRIDWIPARPLPLESVTLTRESHEVQPSRDKLVKRSRILRGLKPGRASTYSQAVVQVAGMGHFFNGRIYRPVAVGAHGSRISLSFSEATYFDYLDTSEILAYQAAAAKGPVRRLLHGRYRRRLDDPFDLRNRVASLGVLTLTLRVAPEGTTFLLHKRNPDRVVLGAELFHVIPAGEFTLSDVSQEALHDDFNLWRNIAGSTRRSCWEPRTRRGGVAVSSTSPPARHIGSSQLLGPTGGSRCSSSASASIRSSGSQSCSRSRSSSRRRSTRFSSRWST